MFDKIGQMMGMLKNLPKLQAAMAEMQQKLGQITARGERRRRHGPRHGQRPNGGHEVRDLRRGA